MEENLVVTCPICGEKIQINEILTKNIETKVREELAKKYFSAINNERKKMKDEYEQELKKKDDKYIKEIQEKEKVIAENKRKEESLSKKEKELLEKINNIDFEISKKLEEEKKNLEKSLRSDVELTLKDKENQIIEKERKISELTKNELELRKEKRELEEKAKSIDLEIERKVEENKMKISEEISKSFEEKNSLKYREYEEMLIRYRKQVEELNHKLDQSSQQLQGEVQELQLEEALKAAFPIDNIKPIAKGRSGADIIQEVINQFGQVCGNLIWESKRTRNWSDNWISKLKDDQRESKSDIAIIVTQAMPEGINNIGMMEGVWVSNLNSFPGLAIALRENLLQINQIKNSQVGKNQKMESIYSYLCSHEFKQRIEAIVEAFMNMKSDLDKEKQYFEKIWAKREKQIDVVTKNTSGMYGDLQALIGAALPNVSQLELPDAELSLELND